jgi:fucose 4-O-acetylase-like acetyltransferase
MPVTQRHPFLDYLKGLLIVLVVFGHALQFYVYGGAPEVWGDPVFRLIYMFHMALFMGISGYVSHYSARSGDLAPQILRRARQLLLPMVLWTFITFLMEAHAWQDVTNLKRYLQLFMLQYWFLWSLFFSFVIACLCALLPAFETPALIAIAIGLILLPFDHQMLVMTRYAFLFYVAGYLVHRYGVKPRTELWVFAGALIVYGASFWAWRNETYIYNNGFAIHNREDLITIAWMLAGAVSGSLVMLSLARFAYAQPWTSAVKPGLIAIGQITLPIYLLHPAFFQALTMVPALRSGYYAVDLGLGAVFCALAIGLTAFILGASKSVSALKIIAWGQK